MRLRLQGLTSEIVVLRLNCALLPRGEHRAGTVSPHSLGMRAARSSTMLSILAWSAPPEYVKHSTLHRAERQQVLETVIHVCPKSIQDIDMGFVAEFIY